MVKHVFASPDMLVGIDSEILARLLRSRGDMLDQWSYQLPAEIDRKEGLDCDAIAKELKTHGIPEEIADALAMVQTLGGEKGWELIEQRSRKERFALPKREPHLNPVDYILLMMLDGGEPAKRFLTKVASLSQAKQRVAYAMFPHRKGVEGECSKIGEAEIEALRQRIADGLVLRKIIAQEQVQAVRIFEYGMGEEVMYIVRYPGQLYRAMGWDPGRVWKNFIFNPARYDTVIFDPVNKALKTNTRQNASKLEPIYRMAFSEALFGKTGVFVDDPHVVGMGDIGRKPLKEIFHAGGVKGLQSIKLVSITFVEKGTPSVETVFKVGENGNLIATDKMELFDPGAMVARMLTVRRFTVRYVLERGNVTGLLAVECGNVVSYPRETTPTVLEQWLRERRFIRKEGEEPRPSDFWARAGKAAGLSDCLETWHVHFGSAFEIAKNYLRKTEELAKEYPHPHGGFPLVIVEDEDGIRAVSNEEGDERNWHGPKDLTREEATAYTFDLGTVGGELCARCELSKSFQEEGGMWRLGVCENKAVYGYFGPVEDALRPLVKVLSGRSDVGCVFVPTVEEGVMNFARGESLAVVPMGTCFKFDDGGVSGGCGKKCKGIVRDLSNRETVAALLPAINGAFEERAELLEENERLAAIVRDMGDEVAKVITGMRAQLNAKEMDLLILLMSKDDHGQFLSYEEIGKRLSKPVSKQAVSAAYGKWERKKRAVWSFVEKFRNPPQPDLFSAMSPSGRRKAGVDTCYEPRR